MFCCIILHRLHYYMHSGVRGQILVAPRGANVRLTAFSLTVRNTDRESEQQESMKHPFRLLFFVRLIKTVIEHNG